MVVMALPQISAFPGIYPKAIIPSACVFITKRDIVLQMHIPNRIIKMVG